MIIRMESVFSEKVDKGVKKISQTSFNFSYKRQSLIGDPLRRVSLSIVLNKVRLS